jgi:hypothetical protein
LLTILTILRSHCTHYNVLTILTTLQFHPGDLSISALGLYWHPGHLKCACCTTPLGVVQEGAEAGENNGRATELSNALESAELSSYYEMDGQAYCETDYLRLWRTCGSCEEVVGWDDEGVQALDNFWHREHFSCCSCAQPFHEVGDQYTLVNPVKLRRRARQLQQRRARKAHHASTPDAMGASGIGGLMDLVDEDLVDEDVEGSDVEDSDDEGGEQFSTQGATPTGKKGMVTNGTGEQAFCRGCFLESFRDKCQACDQFIEEERGGVAACGAMWHEEHLVCAFEGCGEAFFGKNEDGEDKEDGTYFEDMTSSPPQPYCEDHYFQLFGDKCAGCDQLITGDSMVEALGQSWHPEHLVCDAEGCGKILQVEGLYQKNLIPYCEEHFCERFCDRCEECSEFVLDEGMQIGGLCWHVKHFKCSESGCTNAITGTDCYLGADSKKDGGVGAAVAAAASDFSVGELTLDGAEGEGGGAEDDGREDDKEDDGEGSGGDDVEGSGGDDGEGDGNDGEELRRPYCHQHFVKHFAPKCASCSEPIEGQPTLALDQYWHHDHFRCTHCEKVFGEGEEVMEYNTLPYCRRDFLELFAAHCSGCGNAMTPEEVASGECVAMGGGLQFHRQCVTCAHCSCDLGPESTEGAVLKQPEVSGRARE